MTHPVAVGDDRALRALRSKVSLVDRFSVRVQSDRAYAMYVIEVGVEDHRATPGHRDTTFGSAWHRRPVVLLVRSGGPNSSVTREWSKLVVGE